MQRAPLSIEEMFIQFFTWITKILQKIILHLISKEIWKNVECILIEIWQSRFESWKSNQYFQSINGHFDWLPKTNFEKKSIAVIGILTTIQLNEKNLHQNEFCFEASITKIHLISSCSLSYWICHIRTFFIPIFSLKSYHGSTFM